jgi:hypothetical protein
VESVVRHVSGGSESVSGRIHEQRTRPDLLSALGDFSGDDEVHESVAVVVFVELPVVVLVGVPGEQ